MLLLVLGVSSSVLAVSSQSSEAAAVVENRRYLKGKVKVTKGPKVTKAPKKTKGPKKTKAPKKTKGPKKTKVRSLSVYRAVLLSYRDN